MRPRTLLGPRASSREGHGYLWVDPGPPDGTPDGPHVALSMHTFAAQPDRTARDCMLAMTALNNLECEGSLPAMRAVLPPTCALAPVALILPNTKRAAAYRVMGVVDYFRMHVSSEMKLEAVDRAWFSRYVWPAMASRRFLALPVTVQSSMGSHAVILLYDALTRTFWWLDPHVRSSLNGARAHPAVNIARAFCRRLFPAASFRNMCTHPTYRHVRRQTDDNLCTLWVLSMVVELTSCVSHGKGRGATCGLCCGDEGPLLPLQWPLTVARRIVAALYEEQRAKGADALRDRVRLLSTLCAVQPEDVLFLHRPSTVWVWDSVEHRHIRARRAQDVTCGRAREALRAFDALCATGLHLKPLINKPM